MAQRTPIRSILSVLPSQASGETPKGEQTSDRGGSRERNSLEGQTKRSPVSSNRQRSRQRAQQQPQSRQPIERTPSLRPESSGPQQANPLQSGRRSSPPGNLSDISSRRPVAGAVPFSNSGSRSQRPDASRGQKPTLPVNRRPRSPNQQAPQQSNAVNAQQSPPQPTRQPRNRKAKQTKKSTSPVVHIARMLIAGVGIGVIAGTLLSIFDPANRFHAEVAKGNITQSQQPSEKAQSALTLASAATALQLSREIVPLKTQLNALAAQNAELIPGAFVVDIDTGGYIDMNGSLSFSAASVIKVPILIAFFQDVDAGKIRLDDRLTMRSEDIASGSGEIQYQPPGTHYTAMETVTLMITVSDNTATNMLIKRLGGAAALNQRFKSWGLRETAIRTLLPDLEGTNTSSPRDLVNLMAMVNQGKLVSLRSRDRSFEIMRRTVNDSLLPQGLGAGATIAHKTGDIGSLIADVGVIDLPTGKRYLAAVMVKRPHNDPRAEELVRQFSRTAYQHFSQPPAK